MKDKIALCFYAISQYILLKRVQSFLFLSWILGLLLIPNFGYWMLSGFFIFCLFWVDALTYNFLSPKKESLNLHWYELVVGFNVFVLLGPLSIPVTLLYFLISH